MPTLFLKYYYDITRYNILSSILITFVSQSFYHGILSFGTYGMVISLVIYRYYKNIEYYFYMNMGLTKKEIIVKAFAINFIISITLFIILWSIL